VLYTVGDPPLTVEILNCCDGSPLHKKEKKMNYKKYINPIAIGAGLGTAMAVALKDTAVGFAIGVAVAVAFSLAPVKNTDQKNKGE
jgi:hypothetical protein